MAVVQAELAPTVMAGEVDDVNDPFDPVNWGVCAVNRALDEMLLKSFAQFYIAVVPKNMDCRWQRVTKFERSSIFGKFWIDDRFVRCFNGPVFDVPVTGAIEFSRRAWNSRRRPFRT